MKIALLSGKGGAGKTFLAVNLAYFAQMQHSSVGYYDCDVEEPNGHLFFDTPVTKEKTIYTHIPAINKDTCIQCRKCVDFCQFNALVFIKKTPMLLPELCHACGGCTLLCPAQAITEKQRPIGKTTFRQYEKINCYSGILNIGEANGIKIIQELLNNADEEISVIDCPPGSSCSVMESIKDADVCILVAEPTSFGLHNVAMVYELAKILHKKTAVIINKEHTEPYKPLMDFCRQNELPILAGIPFSKEIAHSISEGTIACRINSKFLKQIEKIYTQIKALL